jgi:PIN domain nuclease of toxin-antitoxin system
VRYLLDTHVVLALLDDESARLPHGLIAALEQTDAFVLVSVASLWEIAIKFRLGKLALEFPSATVAIRIGEFPGMTLLDVTADQVVHEVNPWPSTNDPFDRLLLAAADLERAQLVTLDAKLLGHPLAWQPA